MAKLDEKHVKLLEDPNLAHVATLRRDGSPHLTITWIDWDGENVVFNTAIGRAKERHLRRDPRAAVEVVDPNDQFNYVSVSGPVELVDGQEAEDHIDKLAKKYMGVDTYPDHNPDEPRLICRVKPEQVYTSG
ncbi:MAG: PPOX class F420-dependent oxidoreductase [Actinomycetota bacterium]|nr:PPOX class F420-dependent oxidoreductase [Actinomycetota bacterium]